MKRSEFMGEWSLELQDAGTTRYREYHSMEERVQLEQEGKSETESRAEDHVGAFKGNYFLCYTGADAGGMKVEAYFGGYKHSFEPSEKNAAQLFNAYEDEIKQCFYVPSCLSTQTLPDGPALFVLCRGLPWKPLGKCLIFRSEEIKIIASRKRRPEPFNLPAPPGYAKDGRH